MSHGPARPGVRAAGTGSTLLGAMFLMATSAIGPGFITQTTAFTVQLGAAFAFAIAVSIVIDIALQLNVWRVIGVSGRRGPGTGKLVAPLSRRAGVAVDRIVVVLGLLMIVLTAYIAITSGPPVGQALRNVVLPEEVSFLAITTLVGGTIGGYIVYAGAHRLLDSGVSGREHVRDITRGSITGIVITGIMRVVLFLAILGVIGASYTSVSFVTSRTRTSDRTRAILVCAFIAVTTLAFVLAGAAPTTLLVFAGAFNGLLLPIGIAVLLWVATRRSDLLNGYRYPRWLLVVGWAAWLLTLYLAVNSIRPVIDLFS